MHGACCGMASTRSRRVASRAMLPGSRRRAASPLRSAPNAISPAHAAGWRNAKHRAQWRSTLVTYAFPMLGELPIAAIDTALVMKTFEPIWQVKPETAAGYAAASKRFWTGLRPAAIAPVTIRLVGEDIWTSSCQRAVGSPGSSTMLLCPHTNYLPSWSSCAARPE
jgi:hypothetical protein